MLQVARVEGHSFISTYLNRDSVVLDFGMNRGDFASELVKRCGCRVIGLEPVPVLFDALATSRHITVEQRALTGRDDIEALLHVNADKAASLVGSFAAPDSDMAVVRGVTLERFMSDHGVQRADLAKFDVEGAEVEALERAPDEVLLQLRQLTVEFHDFVDPSLRPRIMDIHRKMERLGFRRINFSVSDYDVLYLHAELGVRGRDVAVITAQKFWRGARRRLMAKLDPAADKDRW